TLIIKYIFVIVSILDAVQNGYAVIHLLNGLYKMLNDGWSPDIVIGRATKEKLFQADLIPSTSTLYHWIDRGIMKTKNIDLLEKVARTPRKDSPKHRENRRVLGPSIEERPDKV